MRPHHGPATLIVETKIESQIFNGIGHTLTRYLENTMSTIEKFKAVNHQKSVAWEAERFSEGDQVITYFRGGSSSSIYAYKPKTYTFSATRTGDAWTDNDTKEQFKTLSRWGRARITTAYIPGIRCRSFNSKTTATYLKVSDSQYIHVSRVPARTESQLHKKRAEPAPVLASPVPRWQVPQASLEDRIKFLEDRMLATATLAIFLKQRVETLEAAAQPQQSLNQVRERQQAAVKARAAARASELRSKK